MNLTDKVIQQHIKQQQPSIFRDVILTGFGVGIYPSVKASYIVEPMPKGSGTKRKVIVKDPPLNEPLLSLYSITYIYDYS